MKKMQRTLFISLLCGACVSGLFGSELNCEARPVIGLKIPFDTHDASSQAVGAERAKKIALQHAGFTEEEVQIYKLNPDYENGRGIFEVEFMANNCEYEYDISQADGTIYKYSYEQKDRNALQGNQRVSLEEARNIAFNHADTSVNVAQIYKQEVDYEDGVEVYEINFGAEGKIFKYEVVVSGVIKKYEVLQK